MYDNYNYPPGADNEYAPWNEKENPEMEFDVTVSQTLSKPDIVCTSDYTAERDEESNYVDITTENVDWETSYKRYGYTPLDLINFLQEHLKDEIKTLYPGKDDRLIREYTYIIEACEGWIEDDFEVIKE